MVLTTLNGKELKSIEEKIFALVFECEMRYHIDISVVVKNNEHFEYWLGALPFYDNVEREGVLLE